jgi:hypothetical protein
MPQTYVYASMYYKLFFGWHSEHVDVENNDSFAIPNGSIK